MRKLRYGAAGALTLGGVALTVGLLPVGVRAESAGPNLTLPRTKFVLPGGEIVIGQITSDDGEMLVVRLPRGVMMLRKGFPIATKMLGSASRVARQFPHTKPIL